MSYAFLLFCVLPTGSAHPEPEEVLGPTQTNSYVADAFHLGISEAAFSHFFPYKTLTRSHGSIDILKNQMVGEEHHYWVGTKWGMDHHFIFSGGRLLRYEKCDSQKFTGCVWFDHTSRLRLVPTHRVSYQDIRTPELFATVHAIARDIGLPVGKLPEGAITPWGGLEGRTAFLWGIWVEGHAVQELCIWPNADDLSTGQVWIVPIGRDIFYGLGLFAVHSGNKPLYPRSAKAGFTEAQIQAEVEEASSRLIQALIAHYGPERIKPLP